MSARKAIPLKVKLAAALTHMLREDETGKLVPIISREDAKRMSEDDVLAVFEWDHIHPVALGGDNHHSNLSPLPKADHRAKTAKADIPRIAKVKRITRSQDEFRARLLAKDTGEPAPEPRKRKVKIPSRPFPKKQKDSHDGR